MKFKIAFCICFLALFSCSRNELIKPRLGYLLNITHAVPIVAIEEGMFDEYEVTHFVSGGYLLNSLMSKNIDIAYIGPGPYINAINRGLELELLDLSALGANALVISKRFEQDKKFIIKKIAVPQFGNTQDLLARSLYSRIKEDETNQNRLPKALMDIAQGLLNSKQLQFHQKLEFIAINPAELEMIFAKNEVDAALVAEPWATLLEAKGYINLNSKLETRNIINVLEDEFGTKLRAEIKRLNSFPATLLVVRKDFYEKNPRVIENLLVKNNYVKDIITLDTESALLSIQKHFNHIYGKNIEIELISKSLANIDFNAELDYEKLYELEQIALSSKYIKQKDLKVKNLLIAKSQKEQNKSI